MKVGFIGCGNMGGALAKAISSVSTTSVYLFDVDAKKSTGLLSVMRANISPATAIAKNCDFIFVGLKPNVITTALYELSDAFAENRNAVVVSMAAGVEIRVLENYLPSNMPVIRIMPNTSVAIGKGVTAYAKNAFVTDKMEEDFLEIMANTGLVDALDEKLIDAESAVAGSGPAFAYMFMEALADGAVAAGLPRDKALLYAAKTLEGAAATLIASGAHPAELKDGVCSPGGSTIEGVMTLMREGFSGAVADAVIATWKKAKSLG